MLFTAEELKALTPKTFFEAETPKRIRIMGKEKVEKEKADGGVTAYYKLTIEEVGTGARITMVDFNLIDALSLFNDAIEIGVTVFKITPHQMGEREHKGKMYPIFEYTAELDEAVF